MCDECGAGDGYPHHDWCPVEKVLRIKRVEREKADVAQATAKAVARIEVISEVIGWVKARMKYSTRDTSAYQDVLHYLESIKNR